MRGKDEAALRYLADRFDRLVGRLGFEGKAFGAVLQGGLDAFAVGEGGEQQHAHRHIAAADLGEGLEAGDGHLDVDDGDIDLMLVEVGQQLGAILDGGDDLHIGLAVDQAAQALHDEGVVIGEDDTNGRSGHCSLQLPNGRNIVVAQG